MKLNFLENSCSEPSINNQLFGLCDEGNVAYISTDNQEHWIATVKNDKAIDVVFTPVDKCLINDTEMPGQGRCDGILTTTSHLFFVELKNEKSDWRQRAIDQLESTIELFKQSHDINQFRHKKAFACNKRKKHFQYNYSELKLSFFQKHKVRLDIQAEIIVF